MIIITSKARL